MRNLPYDVAYRCTADENAIVTVLVLQFFFKWNDLLFSMTFISDSSLKTVQTGLCTSPMSLAAKTGGNFRIGFFECVPDVDFIHTFE